MTLLHKHMLPRFCLFLTLFCLILPAVSQAKAFDHKHAAWSQLLKANVHWNQNHTASQVDYAGIQKQKKTLDRYLFKLSAVSRTEFDRFSREEQLAFLINAYNAFTVALILTEYPEIDSIKDLGSLFSSPWKKAFFNLLGESQTLDGIEHGLIRGSGRYNEPLIHFAVNCASVGCPALLDGAFVADEIDQQLLDSTKSFIKDRTRNRFDASSGRLKVSSIFDWYAEDFTKGWRGYNSLQEFFRMHADWVTDDAQSGKRLRDGGVTIDFLNYDWNLNSLK